jgi:uncharacterized protein (TIGR00251 family)
MMDSSLKLRETSLGLEVPLHVLPRAKRCEISGLHNGALKVKVTAPPVDDAANRAIIRLFSDFLHTSKSNISILAGLKSRDKILQIRGVSIHKFRERLARISHSIS